ncbi:MAG: DUF4132 domain-containing protein [Planctomycetales bacterium]|nr:DUF4132 domain-containing protein [Planctomycetales bacterium]
MARKQAEFPIDEGAPRAEHHRALSRYCAEAKRAIDPEGRIKPALTSTGKQILAGSLEDQVDYLMAAADHMLWALGYAATDDTGAVRRQHGEITFEWTTAAAARAHFRNQTRVDALECLLQQLLRRKLPVAEHHVCRLLDLANGAVLEGASRWNIPLGGLIGLAERFVDEHGRSQNVSAAAQKLIDSIRTPGDAHRPPNADHEPAEVRKQMRRLEQLLLDTDISLIEPGEAWSDRALADLGAVHAAERQAWIDLLTHATTAQASKPTKKFIARAAELLAPIGEDNFRQCLADWAPLLHQPRTSTVEAPTDPAWAAFSPDRNTLICDRHADLWKGLAWICAAFNDTNDPQLKEQIIETLGVIADGAYHKVRNFGPRLPKVGNACVNVLAMLPSPHAVAQLERLRAKLKKPSIRKQIDGALEAAAKHQGVSVAELSDTAVPSFGLCRGRTSVELGELTGELVVESAATVSLLFHKRDGTLRKTAPKLSPPHDAKLKQLRKLAKDVSTLLATQRARFESMYLDQRDWPLGEWKQRFVDHDLLFVLATRLVWLLRDGKRTATAVWADSATQFTDVKGKPIRWANEQTRVELWHPIQSTAEEVEAWQVRLDELEIVQPFKQAHREVYRLTPAELKAGSQSGRMAKHILRQPQFRALCEARAWRCPAQGAWDPEDLPHLRLPAHNLRVDFIVAPTGSSTGNSWAASYLMTGPLCFAQLGNGEPVAMADLPPMVFSEIMRDADLFVGVASVGADPELRGAGDWGDYWERSSFGSLNPSASTRRAVLAKLLPRLKIADRCRLDKRFLIVRGDRRTYKIHLGSGNILMEPNQQYLCIVAGGKAPDIRLPFEDDRTLSLILSKAMMLAEDTKIKDPTILAQLKDH